MSSCKIRQAGRPAVIARKQPVGRRLDSVDRGMKLGEEIGFVRAGIALEARDDVE